MSAPHRTSRASGHPQTNLRFTATLHDDVWVRERDARFTHFLAQRLADVEATGCLAERKLAAGVLDLYTEWHHKRELAAASHLDHAGRGGRRDGLGAAVPGPQRVAQHPRMGTSLPSRRHGAPLTHCLRPGLRPGTPTMTLLDGIRTSAYRSVPVVGYRDILRVPYAAQLLGGSLIGRLPTGMAPLAILLRTDHGGENGRPTGLFAAVYLVANAVGGPLSARLVDRYGHRHVLTAGAALSSAAFLTMAACHGDARWTAATVTVAGAARPRWTQRSEPCGARGG